MLLGDSLEFDTNPSTNDAELIPMIKWDNIRFSDIWIPSDLIHRRSSSQTSSNEHKSIICHTLEKHNAVTDSLSIYSDTEVFENGFTSCEKLLDSLEELPSKNLSTIAHHHLQGTNEEEKYYSLKYSPNTIQSEHALDINEGKKDLYFEKSGSSNSSIADYLEHLNISDDEENPLDENVEVSRKDENQDYQIDAELLEACEDKISSVCDVPLNIDDCFVDSVDRDSEIFSAVSSFLKSDQEVEKVDEIKMISCESNCDSESGPASTICDLPLETDTFLLNNEIIQDSDIHDTVASFLNSDQEIYEKKISLKPGNNGINSGNSSVSTKLICNMPLKADACALESKVIQDSEIFDSVYSEQEIDIIELSDKLWNDSKLSSSDLICGVPYNAYTCSLNKVVQGSETSGAVSSLLNSEQEVSLTEMSDKVWNDSELANKKESPNEENFDFSNQTDTAYSFEEIMPEKVTNYPFLLQKPKDENFSIVNNLRNGKKEKKVKKRPLKSIPLDNFFLSKNEASADDAEPEYLDFCESLRQKLSYSNISEKSTSLTSSIFPSIHEFNTVNDSKYLEKDDLSHNSNITFNSPSVNCDIDSTVHETVDNLTRYVIENIPHFVDKEMLHSFLLPFDGIKIRDMIIKQSGKNMKKAIICVNIEDPDWLIECLNGTYPFGVSSGEGLKCYQVLR